MNTTRALRALLLASSLLVGCDSVCSVDGTIYQTGERVPSGDSCNSCRCTVEGVECTTASCAPSDASADASCRGGRCGAPTVDASAAGASCQQFTNQSSQALHAALPTFDTSCSADSDCSVTYLGTACYHGCGTLLSLQGRAELARVSAVHEDTFCAGFAERGCMKLITPCPSLPPFACIAGKCQHLERGQRPERDASMAGDAGRLLDASFPGDGAVRADATTLSDGAVSTSTPIRIDRSAATSSVLVGQTFELAVKALGGVRALDPALSSSAVRFVARRPAGTEEQTPGGPVTIYTFEALAKGKVELVIPFEPLATSDWWPKPYTITIVVE